MTDNQKLGAERQEQYANEKKLPLFAPSDGQCYSCRRNIYDDERTLAEAGHTLITGCPFCCRSYCD